MAAFKDVRRVEWCISPRLDRTGVDDNYDNPTTIFCPRRMPAPQASAAKA